ncbi:enhanced intracellular survival protein Eis [Embleya sp. NPDC059237]|uniref:GNAT family N-acetyltransferase n=1 Tax=Embleya sp. NPDC059237 TaxID=3346784 RepID=UPI0036C6EF1C
MARDQPPTVVEADEGLWAEYAALATRSYGHRLADITRLYDHADTRVGLRDGRVVAGGLGLLVPQFFGGRPVPAACMASGCVAPEERGHHLAAHMLDQRIHPLREQGAVLATLWTTSTGYARRHGWEAPTEVFTRTVPTDDLKRAFPVTDHEITHGASPATRALQHELAARHNGPILRPDWWDGWKQDKHDLATYRFHPPGQNPTGLVSLAFADHATEGTRLVVHDLWAADDRTAAAVFAFLGRHNSRIRTVEFQRTGLPPHPRPLHHLHRHGNATARSWHPWMLRVLDIPAAVRLRGWPDDVHLTLTLEVDGHDHTPPERFILRITAGTGETTPTDREPHIRLTRGQFAVWYAGGHPTPHAAAMAGVRGISHDLAALVRATTEREPWLPDHF